MSPQEIARKAMEVGVAILVRDRRIIESLRRSMPISREFTLCIVIDKPFDCCVSDGICVVKGSVQRGDWYYLTWEGHRKSWCFLTDEVYDVEAKELKDALYGRSI